MINGVPAASTGAATLAILLSLSGCSDYWFQNTFRRADWAKETCAKVRGYDGYQFGDGGMISMDEASYRLGIRGGVNWKRYAALKALCSAYLVKE